MTRTHLWRSAVRVSVVAAALAAASVGLAQDREPAKRETPADSADLAFPISDRRRRARLSERGGDERTEKAVSKALEWLARAQREDGGWSSEPLGNHDTGVTGLALLAFTARGTGPDDAEYGPVVRKATAFLLERQLGNGLFCTGDLAADVVELRKQPPSPGETRTWRQRQPRDIYDHAIASQALAEVFLLTGDEALREPIESAARWSESQRHPKLAWGYVPGGILHFDVSVTAWMMHGLWIAHTAGLDVPWRLPYRNATSCPVEGAHAWLLRVRDARSGRSAYRDAGRTPNAHADDQRNAPGYPHPYRAGATSSDFGEGITAMDASVHAMAGIPLDRLTTPSLDVIASRPPSWNHGASVDLHSWYWGSFALSQRGGPRWPAWNRALMAALLPHQDDDGSWSPVGVWGTAGRVYATAMACLCLESYYRYDLLDAPPAPKPDPEEPPEPDTPEPGGGRPAGGAPRGR